VGSRLDRILIGNVFHRERTMGSADLLMVCISAFSAVFVLLALLALAMRGLIAVFPEKIASTDAALLAALTSVVSAVFPGSRITKVEEER
jgi:hypothetical protein